MANPRISYSTFVNNSVKSVKFCTDCHLYNSECTQFTIVASRLFLHILSRCQENTMQKSRILLNSCGTFTSLTYRIQFTKDNNAWTPFGFQFIRTKIRNMTVEHIDLNLKECRQNVDYPTNKIKPHKRNTYKSYVLNTNDNDTKP